MNSQATWVLYVYIRRVITINMQFIYANKPTTRGNYVVQTNKDRFFPLDGDVN